MSLRIPLDIKYCTDFLLVNDLKSPKEVARSLRSSGFICSCVIQLCLVFCFSEPSCLWVSAWVSHMKFQKKIPVCHTWILIIPYCIIWDLSTLYFNRSFCCAVERLLNVLLVFFNLMIGENLQLLKLNINLKKKKPAPCTKPKLKDLGHSKM